METFVSITNYFAVKHFLLVILFLALLTAAYSQDIQFGAEAGLNLSGAGVKKPDTHVSGSPLVGFEIGAFADIGLPKPHFSFRPNLIFSEEGYKPDLYGDKVPIHVSFLNVPLDIIYHSSLGQNRWFFGLGPYIAFSLGGKYEFRSVKTDINFGSDPNQSDLRTVDIGADLLAGYRLNDRFILSAKLDWGFRDYAAPATNATIHTRSIGVAVGYVIGQTKVPSMKHKTH